MLDGQRIQAAAKAAVDLLEKKAASRPLEMDSETLAVLKAVVQSNEFRQLSQARIDELSQYRGMI